MESKQDNKLKTPNIHKQMSHILVRYILTIQWLGKITNKELMRTDQGSIREEIENRNEESCKEQIALDKYRFGPMLYLGRRGLSK